MVVYTSAFDMASPVAVAAAINSRHWMLVRARACEASLPVHVRSMRLAGAASSSRPDGHEHPRVVDVVKHNTLSLWSFGFGPRCRGLSHLTHSGTSSTNNGQCRGHSNLAHARAPGTHVRPLQQLINPPQHLLAHRIPQNMWRTILHIPLDLPYQTSSILSPPKKRTRPASRADS